MRYFLIDKHTWEVTRAHFVVTNHCYHGRGTLFQKRTVDQLGSGYLYNCR